MRATFCPAFLLLLLACDKQPPPDIIDPAQLLFLGYTKKSVNCARCHGPAGQGGMFAPDIRKALRKYDEGEVVEFIRNGKGIGKEAMPGFGEDLTMAEIELLLGYLRKIQIK